MDRYLAIDYGTVRVGLAITDPLKIIAQPFETFTNDENLFNNIKKVVLEQNVSKLIIGQPFSLSGKPGLAAEKVKDFTEKLKKAIGDKEIIMIDERFSTAEAEKRMLAKDAKRKTRRANIDKTAAAIILENYLNQNK
jgi:putative Holliday junction resolvase